MAKELENLFWTEDLLPAEHLKKRMFGGFAYYLEEKLVLVAFESEGNKTYRGQKFDFELWYGCMFPAEKENHPAILDLFPFLFPHPILAKWLYLPAESEDFETNVQTVLRELRRRNPLFGSVPKSKTPKGMSRKDRKAKEGDEEILDTRTPRMFSDELGTKTLQKAKKISDLKNLGPESEKAFIKAGIKTAPQLIQMGWKKAMIHMCKADPRNNHSIFAYAVIGALENRLWNLISDEKKAEARALMKSLRDSKPKKTKSKAQKSKKEKARRARKK